MAKVISKERLAAIKTGTLRILTRKRFYGILALVFLLLTTFFAIPIISPEKHTMQGVRFGLV